jgi:hypothetical protein
VYIFEDIRSNLKFKSQNSKDVSRKGAKLSKGAKKEHVFSPLLNLAPLRETSFEFTSDVRA